jgi:hypothetical protein
LLCHEDVIQMNGVEKSASAAVQRAVPNLACTIGEPGHSGPESPQVPTEEETAMLKTISAALVAVSVLAAPVLAGTAGKTAQAPVTKSTQDPVTKVDQGKSKALNANAGRHHKHYRHQSHKKQVGLSKTRAAVKPAAPAAKRS